MTIKFQIKSGEIYFGYQNRRNNVCVATHDYHNGTVYSREVPREFEMRRVLWIERSVQEPQDD